MSRRKKYIMQLGGRPQLMSVFSSWLSTMSSRRDVSNCVYYDDDYDMNFDDVVFPMHDAGGYIDDVNDIWKDYFSSIRSGKSHKGSRMRIDGKSSQNSKRSRYKSKMREKYVSKYIDDDLSPIDYDYDGDGGVMIEFYEDVSDVYSSRHFNSLLEFDRFCEEEGFSISDGDANEIAYCSEYHCCLSPYDKEHGRLCLVGGRTYTDMVERYEYLLSFVSSSHVK